MLMADKIANCAVGLLILNVLAFIAVIPVNLFKLSETSLNIGGLALGLLALALASVGVISSQKSEG